MKRTAASTNSSATNTRVSTSATRPELTRVSSGPDAIRLAHEENRFDLIITTLHIDDMHAVEFARMVRASGIDIPVVLLAHDNRELKDLLLNTDTSVFDNVFIWQGDFRIIIAIIKYLEDQDERRA